MVRDKSNFMGDKRFEEESMKFLEKANVLKTIGTKEVVSDLPRQKKGIDLIADISKVVDPVNSLTRPRRLGRVASQMSRGKDAKVDVKAIAKPIPTFSFEVSGNVNSGQIGWFINEEMETTDYLVVYHDIENSAYSYYQNKNRFKAENVIYTKSLLINKKKLQNEVLNTMGLKTLEDVKDLISMMRDKSEKYKSSTYFSVHDGKLEKINSQQKSQENMWFVVSKGVYEQPINIVVRQKILEKIADYTNVLDGHGEPILKNTDHCYA